MNLDVDALTANGGIDVMQVQELMPLATLKAEHARAGASIPVPVDLGDINEEGYHATVESIVACPKIESGPGRVVLTTITHLNDYVFHLTLKNAQGQTETLGVTGFHKLYTEDHGWMSAGALTIGEQIRGDHGDLTVVSLASDPGMHQVYNMTVEADHVYYVGNLAALSHNIVDCNVSRSQYPEAAQHIEDAQAAGQPSEVTIDRAGAAANREAATGGIDRVPGQQLDEYPPAMFEEGGAGASVRPINPADNMGAGASIGNQLRPYPDGTIVRINVVP